MIVDVGEDPIDLSAIASAIRSSSNFRFAWQFYRIDKLDIDSPQFLSHFLTQIVFDPNLHAFLRNSMDNIDPRKFTISPLHEHCSIAECTGEFLATMALGVNDRLGAYCRNRHPSSSSERERIRLIFAEPGDFNAYAIRPGQHDGCEICKQYNHHLFTNWFFDVAWDFVYFVSWPTRRMVWMGCLTDTD